MPNNNKQSHMLEHAQAAHASRQQQPCRLCVSSIWIGNLAKDGRLPLACADSCLERFLAVLLGRPNQYDRCLLASWHEHAVRLRWRCAYSGRVLNKLPVTVKSRWSTNNNNTEEDIYRALACVCVCECNTHTHAGALSLVCAQPLTGSRRSPCVRV